LPTELAPKRMVKLVMPLRELLMARISAGREKNPGRGGESVCGANLGAFFAVANFLNGFFKQFSRFCERFDCFSRLRYQNEYY
jgi:hypothetical protein